MKERIENVLKNLSEYRKVFCSEADFQHAFAWEFHKTFETSKIFLEYPITINYEPKKIDIFIELEKENKIAIELKYKTNIFHYENESYKFDLFNQGAHPQARYDYLKDIKRLEDIKSIKKIEHGFAIFLTNDKQYWTPSNRDNLTDEKFRIHDNQKITGNLKWRKKTSDGTKKGRLENINLKNEYKINWQPYSELDMGKNSEFKYLILQV